MEMPLPLSREIVLIGGGHTHALLLRSWGMNPLPGARLTIINPSATAPYTGMLPGHVAGLYPRDVLEIDLVRLAQFAGARIILGWATGIDLEAKTIAIDGRMPVSYDLASIDIGITSDMPAIPGFSEHAIAAKPLGPFAARWRRHLEDQAGPCIVIGAGVAGVELALAMKAAMGARGDVTLIEAENALAGVTAATRKVLLRELGDSGIALHEKTRVARVEAEAVHLEDGRILPAKLTVGAAGARPFGWLASSGLGLVDGYIKVDATLRSSDPAVFAAGDCAHLSHAPRPKAGVFAVRAAPVLTHNLAAAASGSALKRFKPQSSYLKLIALGDGRAVADKWGLAHSGRWVWRWKDRIDTAFMDKLADLPVMKPAKVPNRRASGSAEALGPKPLCGGCGAKVGAGTLDRVLAGLPVVERADVEMKTGDDAAILAVGNARQVITTDHLRPFWNDPYIFSRIAALHAMGDVWAMGAEPQAALMQLTLPPMTEALEERWMAEMTDAAGAVFAAEGAAIVGGHTTRGAELTLGFTVTGIANDRPLSLGGANVGDALILTRPIGSGTLLAALMAGEADGRDIEGLISILTTSQGDAARVLAHLATAMTDVTGFGLAGHLARMAEASGVTARLRVADVPVFAGALELSARGTRSSVWEANRAVVPQAARTDDARVALMFDPQTAGGFLAALPAGEAEQSVRGLRHLGHHAAIVGAMEAPTGLPLILAD